MEQYEDHMEPEDRKALMDKYNALKMQKFTERVMKELLAEQEEKKRGVRPVRATSSFKAAKYGSTATDVQRRPSTQSYGFG